MSGGVSLGQVLGIIGNVPILKNVLGHTVDKLKIPRHLDIGTPPNILQAVMNGGPGALLQSPLGSALAPLTSGITGAIAQLAAAGGGAGSSDTNKPLETALCALSTSSTNLSALADNLVGYATNTALPTQSDLVAHMSTVQPLGSAVPANLSLATVLQPVSSSPLLIAALPAMEAIVAQVIAGTMMVTDAVTAVQAIQAGLDAVTNASTGAIATVQAAQLGLCAAQSAVALLVAGSPEVIAAMRAAIRPDMMATVQALVDAHNATLAISAASQAKVSEAIAAIAEAQEAGLAQTAGFAPYSPD